MSNPFSENSLSRYCNMLSSYFGAQKQENPPAFVHQYGNKDSVDSVGLPARILIPLNNNIKTLISREFDVQ